jgi:hypothetical protein
MKYAGRLAVTGVVAVCAASSLRPARMAACSSSRLFGSSIAASTSASSSSYIYDSPFASVHLVPMFSDNYGFVVIDKASNTALTVDPGDGEAIRSYMSQVFTCGRNRTACLEKFSLGL